MEILSAIDRPARRLLRFWERLVYRPTSGCLEWTGARGTGGYGAYGEVQGETRTHRIAWALANGPIPPGMVVCHRCDNPPCCMPAHLFLGTARVNANDKAAKGRHSRHYNKLTLAQETEIQALCAKGALTQAKIGALYGVSQAHVCKISTPEKAAAYHRARAARISAALAGGH